MSLEASERETTMTINDDEKVWVVSSYRRADITRLKKNPDLIVLEEGVFEGTPFLSATLPLGGIAIRAKSSGGTRRQSTVKRAAPSAQKCSATTAAGKPCGSIAMKTTGKCFKHSK